MSKNQLTAIALTCSVPALAGTGLFLAYAATRQLQGTASEEFLLLIALIVFCSAILLWWISAFSVTAAIAFMARFSHHDRTKNLPRWIPRFMRNALFALVGLSMFSTAATAVEPETIVTAPSVPSSAENIAIPEDRQVPEILPFFTLSGDEQAFSSEDGSIRTEPVHLTLTASSDSQSTGYMPFSPFFQFSDTTGYPAETPTQELTVVVEDGDTLWDIVSRTYQTQDPDVIIKRIEEVAHMNQEHLKSPEIIYAGQVLSLPAY